MQLYPGWKQDYELRSNDYWYNIRDPNNHKRYVLNNCSNCGKLCLLRIKELYCSKSCGQVGNKNAWTKNPAYNTLHGRLIRERGKADSCVWGCIATRYEWAHYLDETGPPDEYFSMCARCATRYDAAIKVTNRKTVTPWFPWKQRRPYITPP